MQEPNGTKWWLTEYLGFLSWKLVEIARRNVSQIFCSYKSMKYQTVNIKCKTNLLWSW